jgi:NAD(P)H-dependent FMN reductase
MLEIAVVVGSTRPGRRGPMVAEWVMETLAQHPAAQPGGPASLHLVDLAEFDLPLLDEPLPAMFGQYQGERTRAWAHAVAGFDAFVFVTPEYNHSLPAGLKNAIDLLWAEWNDKAAGFVSYGGQGGTRAVEHLRQVLAEMKVAGVRSQVALSVFDDFIITDPTEPGELTPRAHHGAVLTEMFDELVAWAGALQGLRRTAVAGVPA